MYAKSAKALKLKLPFALFGQLVSSFVMVIFWVENKSQTSPIPFWSISDWSWFEISGQLSSSSTIVSVSLFGSGVPSKQKEILKLQGYRFKYKIDKESIIDAIDLVRKAERPILYVGGGTIISNAYLELFELAKIFSIPVTTTLMGKGAFDEKEILSLGMLGMHGTYEANNDMHDWDLLINVRMKNCLQQEFKKGNKKQH